MTKNSFSRNFIFNGEYYTSPLQLNRSYSNLAVRLIPSGIDNIYQCEFGVLDKDSDEIDTSFRTRDNNYKDTISEVAEILYDFVNKDSARLIKFSGLDMARTRLFTIWIASNWELTTERFIFYGYNRFGKWETYKKEGRYGAVLLKSNH